MHLLDDEDIFGTSVPATSGLLFEPLSWHQDARCAQPDVDPDIFYVERGQSSKAARAVCAECCVRDECFAYALSDPDAKAWGVWGGTTPRERRENHSHVVP